MMSILGDLVKLYELWDSWKDKKPTHKEVGLLKEALKNSGKIFVIHTNETGEFVRIGCHDYLDKTDPAERVRALESLEKLFRRGLVRHEQGALFCLSGSGFDCAREKSAES